ncbi:MAG: MATE family efflux transporter [Catonella sp.]|uniref:MATE family efflux transporter n=1 Tax=Catonella sp. TaxID=2382125 RepID=UPI003FA085C5
MQKSYRMDMTEGPLTSKIIQFTIPVMLSAILQLLFNTADVIVVGRFSGKTALAAVGSTGALINMLVSLFMGLSIGTNVLVARYQGAKNEKSVSETVHTSIALGVVGGIILLVAGLFAARPLLELMATPEDVIDQSTLYMRIIFLGMPLSLILNFGAAVLRAVGDTKRPLYYLTIAGVVNVILNVFLVTVFHLGVAGVAIATVISQAVSCTLIIICLKHETGSIKLYLNKIKITPDKCIDIMKIGLPAGLQGCIFSISNVLIQSSVNSFGSTVMAGNTAAGNIEGFVYVSMNSLHQTCISFTSQNFGAGKFKRIKAVLINCIIIVTITGLVLGNFAYLFGNTLLSAYNNEPEVIGYGLTRLSIIARFYFLCGLMDVMVGAMRGIGYSILPMIVSLIGACGLRIVWIYTIFVEFRSLHTLFLSYPVTWIITFLTHLICYYIVTRKYKKMMATD